MSKTSCKLFLRLQPTFELKNSFNIPILFTWFFKTTGPKVLGCLLLTKIQKESSLFFQYFIHKLLQRVRKYLNFNQRPTETCDEMGCIIALDKQQLHLSSDKHLVVLPLTDAS